jgi:hypothetical protein
MTIEAIWADGLCVEGFWHSREDAYKGGLGPWHKKARAAGREMYEKIVFGTWRFVVEEGARGWRCVEWDGE